MTLPSLLYPPPPQHSHSLLTDEDTKLPSTGSALPGMIYTTGRFSGRERGGDGGLLPVPVIGDTFRMKRAGEGPGAI